MNKNQIIQDAIEHSINNIYSEGYDSDHILGALLYAADYCLEQLYPNYSPRDSKPIDDYISELENRNVTGNFQDKVMNAHLLLCYEIWKFEERVIEHEIILESLVDALREQITTNFINRNISTGGIYEKI